MTMGSMVCMAGTAHAQSAANESSAGDGSASTADGQLNEIIVTAQRRNENIQDVPIAIVAVTADTLVASGATNIQDIKMVAPGVEVQSNNGSALPIIRGVGSKAVGAGIENPVAIYVDGVYYAAATASLFSFNNIERLEVLKGPQGTLFGRNATGGLIQIITRDPRQSFEAQANLGYGNYETVQGDLYLTGGLTDNLAADFAATATFMGNGYGSNLTSGRDVYRTYHDIALRSKFLLQPGDDTEARLTLDYSDSRHSMHAARMIEGVTAPAPYGPAYGGSAWDISSDVAPMISAAQGGAALRIDHDFGAVKLASITAYRDVDYRILFDIDYTPTRGRVGDVKQSDWQFSQEIQLLSDNDGPINWVLGGYYFRAKSIYDRVRVSFLGPAAIPAGPLGSFVQADTFSHQGTDSISAFGQATHALSPRLNLTAGLRYTSEKRDLAGRSFLTTANGVQVVTTPQTELSNRFNKLTWRLALDYELADDVLAYASFNRGFKSGGFNPSALTLPPFVPEVLDAYEVGLKSMLFDRRVRLNLSGFYYDYSKLQVSRSVSGATGIYNGGAAEIYGFEAEINAQLTSDLTLTGGYQYTHGKYTSFPGAVVSVPRVGGGETITSADVTGNWTVLTPKSALNLAINYSVPLERDKIDFNAGVYYNSGYFHEPDNRLKEPAYALVNASIAYKFGDGYSIALWGKNLTNNAVANAAGIISFGTTGLFRASYAPPRTYGVTLGAKF